VIAPFALLIIGLIVEIVGATVLGRAFVTRVHFARVPCILISALLGTKYAKSYAHVAPDGAALRDRREIIFDGLRGTALLWIGFLLQFASVLTQWLLS
jgi:hypothetical protein